jgi:hypothetical protein
MDISLLIIHQHALFLLLAHTPRQFCEKIRAAVAPLAAPHVDSALLYVTIFFA